MEKVRAFLEDYFKDEAAQKEKLEKFMSENSEYEKFLAIKVLVIKENREKENNMGPAVTYLKEHIEFSTSIVNIFMTPKRRHESGPEYVFENGETLEKYIGDILILLKEFDIKSEAYNV